MGIVEDGERGGDRSDIIPELIGFGPDASFRTLSQGREEIPESRTLNFHFH